MKIKILIVNDLLIKGGAEMQGIRELHILREKGHQVNLLTFDEYFPSNDEFYNEKNGFYNIKINNSGIYKVLNKLFFNYKLYKKITMYIDKFSPDVIHINNLYLAPKTQFKALGKYNCIQTIRDYSAVCPRDTCITLDNKVCSGCYYNNCYSTCGKGINELFKIYRGNLLNKTRRKNIKKYLCPSEKLTEYCERHKYDIQCINNPFDFDKFKTFNKKFEFTKKTYLYYGAINSKKGIIPLLEAFNDFSKEKDDVELILAGKIDNEIKDKVNYYLDINNNIKYIGFLQYDKMISFLENTYSIIVPSVWMENYPNTVLEGQATYTLVLGSNRGGIPDMLSNGKGIIFDIDNKIDIIEKLEYSYNLSLDEYKSIINKANEYVKKNNSFETYYERIIKQFNIIRS